jgi:hypothetical protein
VSELALSSRIAAGERGTAVLLFSIELCSRAFRAARAAKTDIVPTALFGDGEAAAIVRCQVERGIATVCGATEHLWRSLLASWDAKRSFMTGLIRFLDDGRLGRSPNATDRQSQPS